MVVGRRELDVLSSHDVVGVAVENVTEFMGDTFYHHSAIPLVIITAVLAWQARPSTKEEFPAGFHQFQACYLSVWGFCAAADWLQGPYIYALYSSYNFRRHEIAQLFVAGFASSLVFSCAVGAICDRFGRKRCALAYCVIYIVSCLVKHVKSFWVLMIGRVTGGIATSLLFSCFECWMVSEHSSRRRFSDSLLSYMFGRMYTLSYLMAIISGIVGEVLADRSTIHPVAPGSLIHSGGILAPFDLAILVLLTGGVLIICLWDENYGEDEGSKATGPRQGVLSNFSEALQLLLGSRRLLLLGLGVACFEGSMFAFIFNWTPALQSKRIPPPYGLIFSLLMMSCMCGASISTLCTDYLRPNLRLVVAFLLGTGSLAIAAGVCDRPLLRLCFALFCVFEFCVGVYFPSMGALKSELVPERVRSTVYNLYRVPLNVVVIAALLSRMSTARVFLFCASLLGCGALCLAAVAASGARGPGAGPPAGKAG